MCSLEEYKQQAHQKQKKSISHARATACPTPVPSEGQPRR